MMETERIKNNMRAKLRILQENKKTLPAELFN